MQLRCRFDADNVDGFCGIIESACYGDLCSNELNGLLLVIELVDGFSGGIDGWLDPTFLLSLSISFYRPGTPL